MIRYCKKDRIMIDEMSLFAMGSYDISLLKLSNV